jgi:hypothetical protein
MSNDLSSDSTELNLGQESINVVAWTGIGFGLIAAVLYAILFLLLNQLPTTRQGFDEIRANTPAITRFLVVGASAGLLNVVSLILCLIGYVLPRRSRWEAVVGSVVSSIMLLAIFSVVIVAILVVR